MTKSKLLYSLFSISFLLGGTSFPGEATRWNQLTDLEKDCCGTIAASKPRLVAAVQEVANQTAALSNAQRQHAAKKPDVCRSVTQLRQIIEEFPTLRGGFQAETLPHFTPGGSSPC